jgi:uncharacterized protein (TIGR01777 family)
MKIAVAGASGLIGTALTRQLRRDGHRVLRLVRRPAAVADEVSWDPQAGTVDLRRLDGVDAIFHLAGAGVGDRLWTAKYKAMVRDSRVQTTHTLATAVTKLEHPPEVLVAGSAIGYYGQTGDVAVDESASKGDGFLADVVQDWEAAADPAREAGIRVVHARAGLVVSPRGGAWGRLFPIFALGLGGRLGSGRQFWSFVSLRDEVAALVFFLDHLEGVVNVTAPNPTTNAHLAEAMGKVMHRPARLPVPAAAIKLALGEFSSELLGSVRVLPTRLEDEHFVFQDPTIEDAVRWAWSERRKHGS